MSIQAQLMDDLKAAMKSRNAVKVGTIRMLRAQLKDAEIAKREDLSEEEEISALRTAAKRRREAIEMYRKSSREDLLEKEKAELDIISGYLPKLLSKEEIEPIAARVIAEVGAATIGDVGKVMGPLMKQLKGKADGKLVQQIARSRLAEE